MHFGMFKYSMLVVMWLPALAFGQPVTTVDHVDLTRYLGRWYEIAAIPQYFQRMCVRDVTAEYALNDGGISVTNRCTTDKGTSVAQGQARLVDPVSNAKLEVTFVKIFAWQYLLGGDYWIIDLAADYRYAVVGHPNRKYAWVLAATPHLASADIALIVQNLQKNGYDTCQLITTIQTNGLSVKQPLCESVTSK